MALLAAGFRERPALARQRPQGPDFGHVDDILNGRRQESAIALEQVDSLKPGNGGCATLCLRSPQYYLNGPGRLPNGSVIIGGVNFNSPVSTAHAAAVRLALRGNAPAAGGLTPLQRFNRQFVAAQLSLLAAAGANPGPLGSPLGCYHDSFAPVRLANDAILSQSSSLGELIEQAGGVARRTSPRWPTS